MANQALHEIFSTRMWDFQPEALHGYKNTVLQNLAAHLPFHREDDRAQQPYLLSSASAFRDAIYVANTVGGFPYDELSSDDRLVNVVPIQGAILRSGDACSYGSKHQRDAIKRAADDNRTLGHLLLIDSPGGSSFAKYDYEEAIQYARSKGQPVIALIDGMACSAGYAAASMCDRVFVAGLHDQVGCIGTMAAFLTNKDGDVNAVTQERYVEVYATASPHKNKEYRDAAEGNYADLQAEVDRLCADFQQAVKQNRPAVTDEQLKGATYTAADVMGTMVDGQKSFDECVQLIIKLAGENGKSINGATRVEANDYADDKREETRTENQNFNEMKEYPKLTSVLGLEATVQADKDGYVSLNEEQVTAIEALTTDKENLQAQLAEKQSEMDRLNEEHAKALEEKEQEHTAAIDALKQEHADVNRAAAEAAQKQIDDLQAANESLQADINTLNEQLAAKDATIAEKDKALADKEAELVSLADSAPDAPVTGDAPKSNGNGAKQEQAGVKAIFNERMTMEEKAAALKERNEKLNSSLR